ncbi:MAG: PAS domain-containing protein [Methanoregula sp.]|nr:PAS domain-containing protein [Methanoregula sp.]
MTLNVILVGFCLLSAFTTCALGFFVLAKDQKSTIAHIFFACMLGATYWALGEFFIWQAGSFDGVLFWLKVSSLWPFVITLAAHFIFAYTDNPLARPEKWPVLVACLYIPATIFSVIGIFTDTYLVQYQAGTGYVYMPDVSSPVFQVECIFLILIMLSAICAGYVAWIHAGNEKKKKQVRLICLAIATTIFFGMLSGILLPVFQVYTPNSLFVGLFLFSVIITYAINRYGLFTLSTETAIPYILSTMPDGVIIIAMDGRIISANASAARIFSVPEKDLPGRTASRFIPEPVFGTVMTTILEQGTVLDLEAVLDPKENIVASIAGSLVREPEGQPAGIVLIVRDISSRKRQEQALRQATEKISLVSQLTSHDINNLVTGLSGYLSLLEEINTSPPGDSYVRITRELVEKISNNLQFSSEFLHLGTFQPDWQPLAFLVSEAANDLSHEGIKITVDLPPVEVYVDPLSVKVFYNLFDNALRHGNNLTMINISAVERHDGALIIVVEDDGDGIPDGEKERIFQYGVGKHTGLGLAFSRNILEVTGMTITETGSAGKGARFEILVPKSSWRPI